MERRDMAVYLLLLPVFFSCVVVQSETTPVASQLSSQTFCGHQNSHLISELQDLKLKIARLESILEESIKNINIQSLRVTELENLIEGMEHKINIMQNTLIHIKEGSSYADEMISTLEEEVRLLWTESRENNFDIHILESKVHDAEDRLQSITSQVGTMAEIVTEQWIQIRQLEQALQIAEMRTLKAQRKVGSTRCIILRFIRDLSGHHHENVMEVQDPYFFRKGSTLSSYLSRSLQQLKKTFLAAQKYHHKLQAFVQQEMMRNEFTAPLATIEEVVFFVASALITFPIMIAWLWLTSQSS